jgi:FkbM family methyltransferase
MKKLIKKLFNKFGLEIHRYHRDDDFSVQLITAMRKVNIDIIFDIGANTGQFSSELRSKGYSGKIISFEPLTSSREVLIRNTSKDNNWIVHDRAALGNYNGYTNINISKNSYSSSLLPMLNSHLIAEANSKYIGSEKTKIITLDSVSESYLNKNSKLFIKIDTQGFESQVLDGAPKTLKKSMGIICELSLVPLYEGQILWMDMIERLEREGFILWSMKNDNFVDKKEGRLLQIDGVFLKKEEI